MVFINLSVKSIEASIDFYVGTLELFELQRPSRLICNTGLELIIDLCEMDTEEHLHMFEQSSHVKSCFTLSYIESELSLADNLAANSFDFDLDRNIAGSFLKVNDPSGNRLTIHHQNSRGIV